MPSVEIDVTAIVAIWMTGSLVVTAVLGLVLRYGVAPVIEAAARLRGAGGAVAELRERLARQEARAEELAAAVERLEARERLGDSLSV